MIFRPKKGQEVSAVYRRTVRERIQTPHGLHGVVRIVAGGRGPVNALVEFQCPSEPRSRLVVIPRGNLKESVMP